MTSTLITTPFAATATAEEVVEGTDLTGVRALVTGGSSGLGLETARVLALAGAHVTLAVRSESAGVAAARGIERSTGRRPDVRHLDLADLSSVEAFVLDWDEPLHLLVANAGIVTAGLERTSAGRELQLATNHLGHHALAGGLLRSLERGAAGRGGARIVSLSSTAHMRSDVDLDDLDYRRVHYDPQIAYARSKTANSLFAVEATRRWADRGVVANAVNPGGVATGLQRNFSAEQRASLDAAEAAGVFAYKSIEQGASTTMVAAVWPALGLTGGHYLDDCQEAYVVDDDASLADHPHGVKRWALHPERAELLWDLSDAMCGR